MNAPFAGPEDATRPFTPTIHLEPASRSPVYLQIVAAVVRELQRGRFRPGDRHPASADRIGFSSFAEPMLDDVAGRIGAALRELP